MEEILAEIQKVVNNCLGFLGSQAETTSTTDYWVWGNIEAILMQLVATVILFLFVKFFLWNKVTALIEKRQEVLQKNIEEAKEDTARARKVLAERDKEYNDAKKEARQLIDDAVASGNIARDEIVNAAKEEARRRLETADLEIKSQIEKSKKEIKDAIVDVAFLAAEKIVKREIDREKHEDIVKEFIEDVSQND